PNRRLRLSALGDRVAVTVDRSSFDDLVTMIRSAPTCEKDGVQGVRILMRAIGEGKVDSPEDILSRWTWRLARATRKLQDRRGGSELPQAQRRPRGRAHAARGAEARRVAGAPATPGGRRHEENAAGLVNVALEQPIHVAVALLAS